MTEKKIPIPTSWDGMMDSYLKAGDLKKEPFTCFVKHIKVGLNDKDKPQLIYDVQTESGAYKWDVNVTNMRALKELGIKAPIDLLNHNVIFKKREVQNPKTREYVDSLVAIKIE